MEEGSAASASKRLENRFIKGIFQTFGERRGIKTGILFLVWNPIFVEENNEMFHKYTRKLRNIA
jgi:hypothetical protein